MLNVLTCKHAELEEDLHQVREGFVIRDGLRESIMEALTEGGIPGGEDVLPHVCKWRGGAHIKVLEIVSVLGFCRILLQI